MPQDILTAPAPPADARVAYGSDPNQFFDLRLPSKATSAQSKNKKTSATYPLVINIHGGFWRAKYNLDHAGHLCVALTAKGIATANLEYRRVGNDGGSWPGTFADIRSAYSFLIQNAQRHSIDPRQVIVMGHSAGGQLALCLAAHEPSVNRVVSLAGVVDLQQAWHLHLSNDAVVEFLRGTPAEVPDHYREADPIELSIPHAQQWLFCGLEDDVVPADFSRNYVTAKKKRTQTEKEDLNLREIAGAGHFDLIDPRTSAWKVVEQTVTHLLA
jgi:acetyl esterase/lipase